MLPLLCGGILGRDVCGHVAVTGGSDMTLHSQGVPGIKGDQGEPGKRGHDGSPVSPAPQTPVCPHRAHGSALESPLPGLSRGRLGWGTSTVRPHTPSPQGLPGERGVAGPEGKPVSGALGNSPLPSAVCWLPCARVTRGQWPGWVPARPGVSADA